MVFSSQTFLFFFLPAFLLIYAFAPRKNLVLALFSLAFYAWGEGYYALVLLASIAMNYAIGVAMGRWKAAESKILAIGIALNLGILIVYKYAGFFLFDVFQLDPDSGLSIPRLPIGISFFTFQAISYLIDIRRRDALPARSLLDLTTYIAMFPQLIAGPIVRYSTVAKKIRKRATSLRNVYSGLLFFAFGLAQKILIADTVAAGVDPIFALPLEDVRTGVAWTGALLYTLQIFFDFAGYSNMAIGLGLILGFKFPKNFDYPYVSRSITEFWRRWHMSLSSWFRDYLYIPLGGNRLGALKTYRNLFAVFLFCGLWHGAAWTFVVWGLYHGALLTLERFAKDRISFPMQGLAGHAYLLFATVMGWVIFRSETFEQATTFFAAMFGAGSSTITAPNVETYLTHEIMFVSAIGVLGSLSLIEKAAKLAILMPSRTMSRLRFSDARTIAGLVAAFLLIALCMIKVLSGSYSAFIYFRF